MLDFGSLTLIVVIILIFFDGLIFGVAAARAVLSILLIIVGLILASVIGLSIPFLNTANILGNIQSIFINAINHYGPAFFSLPIFWIIGFVVGLLLV
jgi:hypothetical protein